ncbi:hypothetical protein B296_00022154 [Ensete ventricosum]|uniref:Uncharacterized protein n=1 Tax=Ensete ventricosum TaxID=4639 RepID=A0A427AD25_ENSVE|nr:hypothetical protein B296_00022154 [Ensete ventricosum]
MLIGVMVISAASCSIYHYAMEEMTDWLASRTVSSLMASPVPEGGGKGGGGRGGRYTDVIVMEPRNQDLCIFDLHAICAKGNLRFRRRRLEVVLLLSSPPPFYQTIRKNYASRRKYACFNSASFLPAAPTRSYPRSHEDDNDDNGLVLGATRSLPPLQPPVSLVPPCRALPETFRPCRTHLSPTKENRASSLYICLLMIDCMRVLLQEVGAGDADDVFDDLFKKYGKVVYKSGDQKRPTAEADDDSESLSFAVTLAKVANEVKAADIRVLFVKPLVYWTRFFIIVTAFSRPQIDAIGYLFFS